MTAMNDTGKSITEAIRFVARLGGECEHLIHLIKQELSEALLAKEVAKRFKAGGKWIDSRTTDDHQWVYTGLAVSMPLIAKPKRSATSYLVVQISLAGEGIDAQGNHEPMVHVGQWGNPVDFEEVLMGFPMDMDTGYQLILDNERLFRWVHERYETEWCFSLRLTDINSLHDVQHRIIRPMMALLMGESAAEALSGSAAVRYAEVEGQAGQFRTL